MSHYKSYSQYKDSGVEWLGKVPEQWAIKRLRFVALIQNSNVDKKSYENQQNIGLCNYTDVYYNERITPSLAFMPSTASKSEIERFTLLAGDVIITKDSEEADDIGIPAYVPQNLPGIVCGYHLTMLRSYGIEGEFLFRLLQAQPTKAYFLVEVSGVTRFGLGQDTIGNIAVPIPSLEEQKEICYWINRETTRIDALITKKTRFIELLREKRQALITHAVTKGLDPNVKMKDSRVEWLGEVPEHWGILRFQRCVSIAEGQVNPEISPYCDMVLIAPNHIEPGTGRILYTETAAEQNAESGKYLCNVGDVIYSKIRPALRKVCIAFEPSLCSADMYPMRGRYGMDNLFLFWFLLSEPFSAFSVLEADRVAMPKINRESLNSVQLPHPPMKEQQDIIAYLDLETRRIDALIEKTNHSIALLKERRAALITAAVTGQIDVREAA